MMMIAAPKPENEDSRLAALCARAVQEAFTDYERRFHEITSRGIVLHETDDARMGR